MIENLSLWLKKANLIASSTDLPLIMLAIELFILPIKKFPSLKLGWDALQNPLCSPVVLNASNEIAVEAFLNNKIKFIDIYNIVYETLNHYSPSIPKNIDDVIEIDKIARLNALNIIKRHI